MTRVLFIFPAVPLATNYSGAASRYAQNLAALRILCEEVHVVRVHANDSLGPVRDFESASPAACAAIASSTNWRELGYASSARAENRFSILKRSILDPVGFEFPEADIIARLLAQDITEVQPDLIWVEGTDLAAAVSRLAVSIPWIFSQTDLMYRVRQIRHGVQDVRDRWFLRVCRRADEKVARAATCVLTGSTTDGQRLKAIGCARVHVIPVAYEALPPLSVETRAPEDVRIVHVGSLETTANRVGLEAYLRKVHSHVMMACREKGLEPQLWIIGDASRVKEPLAGLLHRSNAVLKGFMPDLSSVLRAFDLTILPYEHDSGYRTKLPLLFSYAQVVVSTRAAVAGTRLEGLQEVCVLLDRLEEFPDAIARLAADSAERERLGRAARAFFERHFTHEVVRDQYRIVIESIPAI